MHRKIEVGTEETHCAGRQGAVVFVSQQGEGIYTNVVVVELEITQLVTSPIESSESLLVLIVLVLLLLIVVASVLITGLGLQLIGGTVGQEVGELVVLCGHLNGPEELFALSLIVNLLDLDVETSAPV